MGRRGLGRGLSSIIPDTAAGPARGSAGDGETAEAVDELVRLGFDLLEATIPVDVCGYLHLVRGAGPRLVARGAVDADALFEMGHTLGLAIEEPGARSVLTVAGRQALAVRTEGPQSTGLHVVAPVGGWFEDPHLALVERVCVAVGSACHLLERRAAATES